jgi:hypothetical protein
VHALLLARLVVFEFVQIFCFVIGTVYIDKSFIFSPI